VWQATSKLRKFDYPRAIQRISRENPHTFSAGRLAKSSNGSTAAKSSANFAPDS
jgi:hypothetical protein